MRSLKLVNSVTWHDGNYIAYLEKIESDDKKTAKKKKKKTFTQPIIKKKKNLNERMVTVALKVISLGF